MRLIIFGIVALLLLSSVSGHLLKGGLYDGQTHVYEVDGRVYEISLVIVSDPRDKDARALFTMNGEHAILSEDEHGYFSGAMVIPTEILVNRRGGFVEYYLSLY